MSEALASTSSAGFRFSDVPPSPIDLEPPAEPEIYCIQHPSPWRASDVIGQSLRLGEPVVNVLSPRGVGLVAATFSATWTSVAYQSLGPLVARQLLGLSIEDERVLTRGARLLAALAVGPLGLVADAHAASSSSQPRWRACWTSGASMAVCGLLALASISLALEADSSTSKLAIPVVVFMALTATGSALMELSTLGTTAELSQCESLRRRGSVIGAYVAIQSASAAVADLLCFAFADSTAMGTELAGKGAISTAFFVAAGVAAAPIPPALAYWQRLSVQTDSLHIPLLLRVQLLWQISNQRAVLRVLAFLVAFTLAVDIQFRDSAVLVSSWASAASDSDFLVAALRNLVAGAAVLVWKRTWVNRSWRSLFLFAVVLIVAPHLIVALFVTGVVGARNRYFYRVGMAVTYVGQGLAALANVIPLVEVVHEGMEGSMVGLTLAIRLILDVFHESTATGIFRGDHFYDFDSHLASKVPTPEQWKVIGSLALNFAIVSVGAVLAVLVFLPAQKREMQQLRKHAGYARQGSLAISLAMMTLVAYSVTANALTIDSGLRCSAIASGANCSS